MTTSTGQSDIDRVRDATDLVRLIGEHVALRPRGREHVGLCPFHDDHRPSMAVVTHKEHAFYNCFACGASGDCFRFVMDYHKMDFPEALRFLADRANITLEPRQAQRTESKGPKRSDLLKATSFACEFFQRTLADEHTGAAARAVIAARDIGDEMVEQFQIGAAPDAFDGLQGLLAGRPASLETAHAAGLLRERSGGQGHYDVFRNRLVFPICDEVGRVIAFGGRIIAPDDTPKYLNSPENPLFDKSRTLYGLHLARRAIIESGQAIVTEGYTDVIACHQAGITNVVGTLGTALTRQHALVLGRIADSVILVFDADEAGRKAADRGVEVFFSAPVDVRICVLPDGLDPDSLLRAEDGPERFRAAVEGAVEALDYKLARFEAGLADTSGLSARQKHLEQFLRELGDLGFGGLEGVRKAMVLNSLAELFRVPVNQIERALPRRRPARPAAAVEGGPGEEAPALLLDDVRPISRARKIAEEDVLGLLLFEPEWSHEVAATELSSKDFESPVVRRIAEILLPWAQSDQEVTMPALLARLVDDRLRAEASRLYFAGQRRLEEEKTEVQAVISAAIGTLRDQISREQHDQLLTTVGPNASDGGNDAESVLERLRTRERLGDRPAAIWQGART